MESIDRLREYLDKNVRKLPHTEWIASEPMELRPSRIYGYIDAIESEVKANRVDAYTKGYDEGFASADDWVAQHEDAMAEHGWVKLPVDADGVPIHIGDVLDGYGKTIEVVELRYGRSGWVLISRDGNGYADCAAFTHYHAPTVEDVLEEFAQMYIACNDKGTIAEYAAKLTLRGDE